MLDSVNVGFKIADFALARLEREEKEIPLVVLTLELLLSPELCAELSPFMKSTLYTSRDAAVNPQLTAATFQICDREQDIVFKMAPDQSDESFKAIAATIGPLKATRTKKAPAWTVKFTATFEIQGEHHLAVIADSYTKFRYLTFGDAEPNLVTEAQRQERQAAADEATGDEEAAGPEPARQPRRRRSTATAH